MSKIGSQPNTDIFFRYFNKVINYHESIELLNISCGTFFRMFSGYIALAHNKNK